MKIKEMFFVMLLLGSIAMSGCRSNKTIPYFKNVPESEYSKIPQSKFTELKIQKDDILDVSIKTTDPTATTTISAAANQLSSFGKGGVETVQGFKVDKNGEIEIPVLGNIHVDGLTTDEARSLIRKKAEAYFVDPAVQVRFVNFKISVLGEVARPSTYNSPSEKINILDAIALAGDLTVYGKRENVLLIRETTDGKEMVRFNLNDASLFNSPYYYLKQNDIIYVEPSKALIASTETQKIRVVTTFLGIITTGLLILVRTNVL